MAEWACLERVIYLQSKDVLCDRQYFETPSKGTKKNLSLTGFLFSQEQKARKCNAGFAVTLVGDICDFQFSG